MKTAAKTHEATSAIINRAVADVNSAAVAVLPNRDAMRRMIQRQRRKNLPPMPATLSDLNIEGEWRQTNSGEPWIIFDRSVDDDPNNRMIIFCDDSSLGYLARADSWYGIESVTFCAKFITERPFISGLGMEPSA